jgi:hypothetical protein
MPVRLTCHVDDGAVALVADLPTLIRALDFNAEDVTVALVFVGKNGEKPCLDSPTPGERAAAG